MRLDNTPADHLAAKAAVEGQHPTGPAHQIEADESKIFRSDAINVFRHDFHKHPLMGLDALAELAQRLMPNGQCRFISPTANQASEFKHDPVSPKGVGIAQAFQEIETPGSWIALYNVETDPAYSGFLAEVMAAAEPLWRGQQTGIFNVGGFIFVSAPPSVTPFHIDRENNFWMQIRGEKTMNVWDHRDRESVAQKDVEDFILYGSLDRVRLAPGHVARSREFQVGPGDGVYFPSTSAHMTRCDPGWAVPGNGVSVSIGVVFYSAETKRHAQVHSLNAALRNLGWQPTAPGVSTALDALKAPLGRLLVKARGYRRPYTPPPGLI